MLMSKHTPWRVISEFHSSIHLDAMCSSQVSDNPMALLLCLPQSTLFTPSAIKLFKQTILALPQSLWGTLFLPRKCPSNPNPFPRALSSSRSRDQMSLTQTSHPWPFFLAEAMFCLVSFYVSLRFLPVTRSHLNFILLYITCLPSYPS